MKLTLVHPSHAQALLNFEQENRAHFEQWIASRGDAYYHTDQVRNSLEQAQWLANAGREYHYLAWLKEEIIGRITLRGIEREHYHKASVGYRFSARHAGHGYASQAVNLVCEQAFRELTLHRLEAVVIIDNHASRAVMKNCGFQQYGHARSSVLRHGIWMDMLHFERLAPEPLQTC
ncbi:GNAT family N-acetyltransferase [Undibacterium rugosum]|uniref:GNAT family N-acetyltransferase n=1 Tax=Undibacterium rugosum TaxID=2762291 RepID=A0A923KZ74_9BURK|nr:GNAT family protein [Undibacterium rugosum]MBC3935553.1 GNAT family N-acetyltransferase [Undibacterium rugosum]MBR7778950.1 GNAT family N-acetyltransferase [Undibacterium rugosum]